MKNEEEDINLDLTTSTLDFVSGFFKIPSVFGLSGNVVKKIEHAKQRRRLNNMKEFFKHAEKTTEEQREKFEKEMSDDFERFDNLLLSFDELDHEYKADIMGKLFKATLEVELVHHELTKFISILRVIHIETLKFLLEKQHSSFGSEPRGRIDLIQFYNELLGLGLAENGFELREDSQQHKLMAGKPGMKDHLLIQKYKITHLGALLIHINSTGKRP